MYEFDAEHGVWFYKSGQKTESQKLTSFFDTDSEQYQKIETPLSDYLAEARRLLSTVEFDTNDKLPVLPDRYEDLRWYTCLSDFPRVDEKLAS